ncbi:oxygenase MpaB family protein [Phenylobacterium sp. LjRoot219]|uniref:oxygenase MpaB family protein n=1 Tax=Phenylobacterium sp. LjRoot219 TaxID=3342283 RepID=UPI003F503530
MTPHPQFGPSSLRQAIVLQVRQIVGGTGDDTIERNRQDTGFFGPESVCWKVHGDLASMMVGGITALLVQMLHPGALAGVWDHTDFRHDMAGRLKRTAHFIAGTTYGDRAEAQAYIARVRAIHARVAGTLADGTPYSADDPELLTWVHVAEVSSFLAAYVRYVDPALPPDEQDRYFRETAEIARRLGSQGVPQSRAEIAAYFRATRPKLRYDERTREVALALLSQRPPSAAVAPAMSLAFDAAKELLPDWAAEMHGFRLSAPRRAAARLGVQTLGRTLRWALINSAEARARRRAEQLAREERPAQDA